MNTLELSEIRPQENPQNLPDSTQLDVERNAGKAVPEGKALSGSREVCLALERVLT